MQTVNLDENKGFDELVKRFKRLVNKSNVLLDYKKHDYYVKPGLRRKLKREQARKNRRKY